MTTRTTKPSKPRRLTKDDGRASKYAMLKAAPGVVIPEVKKVLLDRQKSQPSIRRGMYPSEMASSDWCPRATFYRMSGRPEPPSNNSFQLENVFAHGNQVHSKWQDWLSDTGKLWGDWRCYRCGAIMTNSLKPTLYDVGLTNCVGTYHVSLNGGTINEASFPHDWKYKEVTLRSPSLPISGHADGALVDHDILIEFKSLGIGSLRYSAPTMLEQHTHTVSGRKIIDVDGVWREFHKPLPSHVRQANLYLWMCNELGLPFTRISFIYEYKANNSVKEFIVPYSEEIVAPMLETAHIVITALDSNIAPECPKGGCGECKKYEGGK